MKERPILFNGDMVRAILDGRKTQTRRIVKPMRHPYGELLSPDQVAAEVNNLTGSIRCPLGRPGDRLWVRETWQAHGARNGVDIEYCADNMLRRVQRGNFNGNLFPPGFKADGNYPWRPSIHMPRWASRITLEITAVRVERLNEIGNEDAQKEGITSRLIPKPWGLDTGWCADWSRVGTPSKYAIDGNTLSAGDICHASPRLAFWNLWESIYGPGTFDEHWAWVTQFKRVTP